MLNNFNSDLIWVLLVLVGDVIATQCMLWKTKTYIKHEFPNFYNKIFTSYYLTGRAGTRDWQNLVLFTNVHSSLNRDPLLRKYLFTLTILRVTGFLLLALVCLLVMPFLVHAS